MQKFHLSNTVSYRGHTQIVSHQNSLEIGPEFDNWTSFSKILPNAYQNLWYFWLGINVLWNPKAGKDKSQCFRPHFIPTKDWLLSKKPKSPVIDHAAGLPIILSKPVLWSLAVFLSFSREWVKKKK